MCVEITKAKLRGTKSRIENMKTRPSDNKHSLGIADEVSVTLVNGKVHIEFDVIAHPFAMTEKRQFGIESYDRFEHVSLDFACLCFANQWVEEETLRNLKLL